jgi:hypothetical protein
LSGDSIHSGTIWLQLDESVSLQQFLENLQRVQDRSDALDHILPGHGRLSHLPLPKHVLADLIAGIETVLRGEIDGREERTFAGDGLCCDFGSCSIIYRPDRL